jgi:hypothetical protein
VSWPEPPAVCRVCGEPADDDKSAVCNWCGLRFHLALRQDQAGKDCGRVWVNDAYMALEYGCQACLRGDPLPGEDEPPVGTEH